MSELCNQIPIEHYALYSKAAKENLKKAGYETIGDILDASQKELMEVDYVSYRVCRRIKRGTGIRLGLTTIPGIGDSVAADIKAEGYDTEEKLWNTSTEELAEIPHLTVEMAERIHNVIDPDKDVVYTEF
jgi:excinuclease UvrABC nuclease subunit